MKNTARGESCDRCGWKFGPHICVDLSYPDPRIPGVNVPLETPKRGERRKMAPHSDLHRAAMSAAQKLRWQKIHEKNRVRNERIVERYRSETVSIKQLGKDFEIGKDKVMTILHAAVAAGELVMRPPGTNIAKGAFQPTYPS